MTALENTLSGYPTRDFPAHQPGLKIGVYELLELLGQGGMGQVWKAQDTQGNRLVAVKLLPPEFRGNEEAIAQVRTAFEAVHDLTHQGLCKMLALVEDAQHGPYIVMDYFPGITLSKYRRTFPNGRLSVDRVVSILGPVAEALDYAHQKAFQNGDHERKGILHRDVKPQNIMLCIAEGKIKQVCLIDLGLAAEIRSSTTRFTQARVDTRGTRPYMSPEQLSGKRSQWDARTDQYSLGVVAYELLSGHPPFEGDDDAVLMHAIANAQPDPLDGLSGPVNAVLIRALAKKREERFSCCLEFIRALRNPETATITAVGREKASLAEKKVRLTVAFAGDRCFAPIPYDSSWMASVLGTWGYRVTDIKMDGRKIGSEYLEKGFRIAADIMPGQHVLLLECVFQSKLGGAFIKSHQITFVVEKPGVFTLHIGSVGEELFLSSLEPDRN